MCLQFLESFLACKTCVNMYCSFVHVLWIGMQEEDAEEDLPPLEEDEGSRMEEVD